MAAENILVVEDGFDNLILFRHTLSQGGYQITEARTGEEGLMMALRYPVDLVLLDWNLPGIEGIEVCRRLKSNEKTKHLPIIMVTSRQDDIDMVIGLEMGADDYIIKPFTPRILLARIKAVLRRFEKTGSTQAEEIVLNDLFLSKSTKEASIGKTTLVLSSSEFDCLFLLASRPGWVYSREQIMDSIHGQDHCATPRSVDVLINSLRNKLGNFKDLLETVRGSGYRLKKSS